MAARHPADLDDDAILRECRLTRTRASGPGGQRRNKVETAVVLEHRPSGLTARAADSRDAEANRRAAARRLRLLLAVEKRAPWSAPTALWTGRVRGKRIAVNPRHTDLPALIAEALDALSVHDWDGAPAATALGVSTSQLVRFLATHAPALALWNDERAARGLRPLRA